MSDYPELVDIGGGVWSSAVPGMPGNHKLVPADAIVIERDESIWTSREHAGAYVKSALGLVSSPLDEDYLDRARAQGVHLLSAVDYLTEHPPIDEAHVTEVHRAIQDHVSANVTRAGAREILRDLQAQGWTKPEPTP